MSTNIPWNLANYVRLVGDVTGAKGADIVAFGPDDIWVALNNGDGSFTEGRRTGLSELCANRGWDVINHIRQLAPLKTAKVCDIIGFGFGGVWTALSKGDGSFQPAALVLADFGVQQGWNQNHPRLMADLTGDGKADIVGFGPNGVVTALNKGDGTFAASRQVLNNFGAAQGWRTNEHVRLLADLTGDGKADLVAFGFDGVWTALGNGDGTFQTPQLVLTDLGLRTGWDVAKHIRLVADVTGDKRGDIVAFGVDGVYTALGKGDGTFQPPRRVIADLGFNQGWEVNRHPRTVADMTGDGKGDVVGFGFAGVWTAVSNGDGTFQAPRLVVSQFGLGQNWLGNLNNQNPRFTAQLTSAARSDVIGFADDGVWSVVSDGTGDFFGTRHALLDFGARTDIHQREISYSLLQSKLDTFFTFRTKPIFQLKMDSPTRTFGSSTVTLAVDKNNSGAAQYDFASPMFEMPLTDLSYHIPVLGDHRYYIKDLTSDRLTAQIRPANPFPILDLNVHFETGGGIEIKAEGALGHDIDIVFLSIKFHFPITFRGGGFDLLGWVDDIDRWVGEATIRTQSTLSVKTYLATALTDFGPVTGQANTPDLARADLRVQLSKIFIEVGAAVDAPGLPDGMTSDDLQSQFTAKIYDALRTKGGKESDLRPKLRTLVGSWLLGGNFKVAGADFQNPAKMSISYTVPPGSLAPFPEKPQPPLTPGLLSNIDHIVVLMLENRSFDHMLGYLSLPVGENGAARADVDGHGPRSQIANGAGGQSFLPFRTTDPAFVNHSPPHDHEPVLAQINNGAMNGFAGEFAREWSLTGQDPGKVLSHYDGRVLSVYDTLAKNYVVCDRWFAAHPGPTFCNRFYTLTGRLNRGHDGQFQVNNFSGADFAPSESKTIFDHLTERGVSWRFYEHRYGSIRLFGKYTFDTANVIDFDDRQEGFQFRAESGTLPSVTFIDPNFIDEPDAGDNDDASPGNVLGGQALVAKIVNSLAKSAAWMKTMLIVTYDEHGGFFDHVNPLDPQFRTNAAPVSGIDHYGVRVPAIVISPWVAKGVASHTIFDHTSIIKTISKRFMPSDPPDMGSRVAAANDLGALMTNTVRADRPSLPVPAVGPSAPPSFPTPSPKPPAMPLPGPGTGPTNPSSFAGKAAGGAAKAPAQGDSTDFKDVMTFLHGQRKAKLRQP